MPPSGGIFHDDAMPPSIAILVPRLIHAAMASVFAWLNLVVAQAGLLNYADQHRAAASFAWEVLASRPQLLLTLATPIVVIAALYSLFFWTLAILGRPRRASENTFARRIQIVLLTWSSGVWLLLFLHLHEFPRSNWSWWIEPLQAPPAALIVNILSALWIGFRITLVARSWGIALLNRFTALNGVGKRIVALSLVALPLSGWALNGLSTKQIDHEQAAMPNILIIGLDSLRRDVALGQLPAEIPHLSAFRKHAFVEENVVTPLARTFPAWVTILTGQPPERSGARGNLVAQTQLPRGESLGWKLKALGYRTIYATDETRFSNIGPEFGFDDVISPQFGARDFLIGHFADQLLINFAVQLPYAEYLLPSLVGNRAFSQAYYPARFVDRLTDRLGPSDARPTAMAIHLCMAHWPYYSAQSPATHAVDDFAPYLRSVAELDTQFGYLQSELRRLGYLNDNTLIVLLADHGEALTLAESAPRSVTSNVPNQETPEAGVGHGTSLLSPSQWQVFLMFSGNSAIGSIPTGRSNALSSLADLPNAIMDLVGHSATANGSARLSVVDATAGTARSDTEARRYVAMETGFRPPGLDVLHPNGSAALQIARSSFDLMDDGRVEIKESIYALSIRTKDFGVTDGHRVLALVQSKPEPLLVFSDGPLWNVFPIDQKPAGVENPPLLDAACKNPDMRPQIEAWCDSMPPSAPALLRGQIGAGKHNQG